MVESMTESEYQILYGILRVFDVDGYEYNLYMNNHRYLNKLMIPHPTCFVTKKTYDDYGSFGLKYKLASDYEFMIKCYMNKCAEFVPVYRIIANFTSGGASSDVISSIEECKIRKEYGIYSNITYIGYTMKNYIIHCLKMIFYKWL